MTEIKKIDGFDKVLLDLLSLNSRMSLSKLAKHLNRSKSFVTYRLKMLNDSYIENLYPLLDISRLGFMPFDVYIKINMTEEEESEFIKDVSEKTNVFFVERLIGDFSIHFSFFERDVHSSKEYIQKILGPFTDKLAQVYINPVSKFIKTNNCFFKPASNIHSVLFDNNSFYDISPKELNILQILNENTRISIANISKKTNLSREYIKKAIAHLEDIKVIANYTLDLHYESFN